MVYVDQIFIKRTNITKIAQLKKHLFSSFQTKDLGYLMKVSSFDKENMLLTLRRHDFQIARYEAKI